MKIPFHFVDVFAERPLTGNPLAVVPDAGSLTETTMKELAAEFNQAETTFITPPRRHGADWSLRSFTAVGSEVDGAGHNSMGAWWWLAESGRLTLTAARSRFVQEIGGELLSVEVDSSRGQVNKVTLSQSAPVFGRQWEDREALATALGLTVTDLEHPTLTAQVVSTGTGHLMVPVRDRQAVGRAAPDAGRLFRLLHDAVAEGCYVFSLDPLSEAAHAHARFFNPTIGLTEDSATGTAAGPLACLLVREKIACENSTVAIEQGVEMKRPSLLKVDVAGGSVRLSGRCVISIEGSILLKSRAVSATVGAKPWPLRLP